MKRVLAILGIVVLGAGLSLWLAKINGPDNLSQVDQSNIQDIKVILIEKMAENFNELQENIPLEPVLGATRWYGPGNVQFWCNDWMLVSFDDGHVIGSALFKIDDNRDFALENAYPKESFSIEEWETLMGENGASMCETFNYETKDGLWVMADRNLFVRQF